MIKATETGTKDDLDGSKEKGRWLREVEMLSNMMVLKLIDENLINVTSDD